MTKKEYILRLYATGAVKFGEFTLKSGIKSPFYIDLRDIISDNALLEATANLLSEKAKSLDFDYVTGIPYTALPVATLMAQKLGKPLIYSRKEEKSYGTKNAIIGKFEKGKKCLVVDDLITSGESIMETAEKYSEEGLLTRDFMVVIDRSKGGAAYLHSHGYRLHSLIRLDEIVDTLFSEGAISRQQVDDIESFMNALGEKKTAQAALPLNPKVQKIIDLCEQKQSRLAVSIVANDSKTFFEKLEAVAPMAVMIIFDIEAIRDVEDAFFEKLKSYQEQYHFLVLQDRQYVAPLGGLDRVLQNSCYHFDTWADFVSMHPLGGTKATEEIGKIKADVGAFWYAKWNRNGSLTNDNYTRKVFEMGAKLPQRVAGYFCDAKSLQEVRRMRNKIPAGQLMIVTASPEKGGLTPEEAPGAGADLVIVDSAAAAQMVFE